MERWSSVTHNFERHLDNGPDSGLAMRWRKVSQGMGKRMGKLAPAVARKDRHAGAVPVAYVDPRLGHSITHPTLSIVPRVIPERVAWPKKVRVLESLPLTAAGKIFNPPLSMLEIEQVVVSSATAVHFLIQDLTVVQRAPRDWWREYPHHHRARPAFVALLGFHSYEFDIVESGYDRIGQLELAA